MPDAKDYFKEFNSKYEQPQINNITVGFSGIDPSTRGLGSGNIAELTDDQMALMKELILNYISNIEIKIDSGTVDPDAAEPVVPYIKLRPSDIPHEELDGLLGGNEYGHYHLTEPEHNRLIRYPEYSVLNFLLMHERLPDLLGGSAAGHWHLTEEERQKLTKLIEALVSTETGEVVIPEDDHEKLKSLYGGELAGHYHLTGFELYRLQKLIELTFPDGAVDPVIPGVTPGGDDTGGGDDPVPSEDPYEFAGLPHWSNPNWESSACPKIGSYQFKCYTSHSPMYFGKTNAKYDATPRIGLNVFMKYSDKKGYILFTQDLNTWEKVHDEDLASEVPEGIPQYLFQDTNVTTGGNKSKRYRLYITRPGSTSGKLTLKYYYGANDTASENDVSFTNCQKDLTSSSRNAWVAMAMDSSNQIVAVSRDGHVVRVTRDGTANMDSKAPVITIGMTVNNGCAAWSPVTNRFCVTGPNGSAVTTGATYTGWKVNNNAPRNLVELTYRSDIEGGVFFAMSAGEKVFYVSRDGENWAKYNNTPIPLSTVTSVAYNPDSKIYCAVGGKGKYAYFSSNLKSWVSTRISNNDVEAGSVIWAGGNIKKFVLLPISGDEYYTFDPNS